MVRKNESKTPAPWRPDAAAGGDRAAVLALWEKVSACIQRKNHAKALRTMKGAVDDHLGGAGGSSPPPPPQPLQALLLHAYSTVHSLVADVSSDGKVRGRHFKQAIEASRRATEAAPDSAVLAHFHATLLSAASMQIHAYGDAIAAYTGIVAECERGIQIKDPSDPALYTLGLVAPDAAQVLSNLRALHKLASDKKRRKEIELKVAAFKQQQQRDDAAAASSSSSPQSLGNEVISSSSHQSSAAGHGADRSEKGRARKGTDLISIRPHGPEPPGRAHGQGCYRKRSDAASEALLDEPALDAEMNANKGGDEEQSHKKSKDKKEFKGSGRCKDLEDSAGREASEQTDAYPNEQEEELRHTVQHPVEETLEYQARIEDEPNLKHLA